MYRVPFKVILTSINAYCLDRPVSGSLAINTCSTCPNGSKMAFSICSLMLKWSEPTYSFLGPSAFLRFSAAAANL